ncbi:MAG: glycoside hydrolase family 3 protein, partial [Bacillota bacterium]
MKKSKNMVPRKIVLGLIFTLTLISTVIFTSIDASYTSRKYTSQYDSKEEAIIAGAELNERIALEGMVLLKNENTVLPLETGVGTDETKVSVFGYKSVFPDGGGSADGDTSDGIVRLSSDIYSSLSDAGYKVNPVIRDVYEQWSEDSNDNRSDYWFAQDSNYTSMLDTMRNSYQSYDDAAVVVLTATNLEPDSVSGTTPNIDPTTMLDPEGNVVPDLHMRELDQGQLDLVDEVTANFDNVIVVINSSVPLEMSELQNNPLVDSIILAGEPGANGFNALGMLMSGEVNFSGRLADTYMADFTK